MDCRLIQDELLPYALGASSDEERKRIDEHIVACTGCLRVYLRLKHQVERGVDEPRRVGSTERGAPSARPSAEVRRRIREDVAEIVRPRGAARVQRWLRRPIPLYQSLAVAAVAAGIAIGVPQVVDAFRKAPETTARVDMSRPVPQALAVY